MGPQTAELMSCDCTKYICLGLVVWGHGIIRGDLPYQFV